MQNLTKIFGYSKSILISLVSKGIHSFNTNRHTYIQYNWSNDSIGYVVLQQYCQCPTNTVPTCYPDGWHLVFAGSRFTTPTDTHYAPTEGEALAVAWGLNNAKMFFLGYKGLIVITDHKLLRKIFNQDSSTINNPRILKIKEKTLQYCFTLLYCLRKWHKSADAGLQIILQNLLDIMSARNNILLDIYKNLLDINFHNFFKKFFNKHQSLLRNISPLIYKSQVYVVLY